MSKTFLFLFSILSTAIFAQQENNLDKNIYTILDNNAKNLLKNSKAYSVSIGIVKNGRVYTKHYGELDTSCTTSALRATSYNWRFCEIHQAEKLKKFFNLTNFTKPPPR